MTLINKLYSGNHKISIPEYNAIPALRSTSLKNLLISPMHFKHAEENPNSGHDVKHFIVGSFIHCAILEPHLINEQFITLDVSGRNTKKYREVSDEALRNGMQVILKSELEDCLRLRDRVLRDSMVQNFLIDMQPEISAVAQINGVWCKSRADGFIAPRPEMDEGHVLFDIKTTSDSAKWFESNMIKYGYDISAAYYIDIFEKAGNIQVDDFFFIVIEKNAPYGVRIVPYYRDTYLASKRKYLDALDLYKECLATDTWPGYNNNNLKIGNLRGGNSSD